MVHEVRHGAGFARGEVSWDTKNDSYIYYDYQDEYVAYEQASNYNTIIYKGSGITRSHKEIISKVKGSYNRHPTIIKKIEQIKAPKPFKTPKK